MPFPFVCMFKALLWYLFSKYFILSNECIIVGQLTSTAYVLGWILKMAFWRVTFVNIHVCICVSLSLHFAFNKNGTRSARVWVDNLIVTSFTVALHCSLSPRAFFSFAWMFISHLFLFEVVALRRKHLHRIYLIRFRIADINMLNIKSVNLPISL